MKDYKQLFKTAIYHTVVPTKHFSVHISILLVCPYCKHDLAFRCLLFRKVVIKINTSQEKCLCMNFLNVFRKFETL